VETHIYEHKEDMNDNGDVDATAKDVKLSELLTHNDFMDKLDNFSVRKVLKYALKTVHEQSVVTYLSHHYSHDVVNAFTRDKLYLVDQSLPTHERIDAAVKRVQKMTPSDKITIAWELS
jgi:secreted Zn-dependent insulinase-like peptidase